MLQRQIKIEKPQEMYVIANKKPKTCEKYKFVIANKKTESLQEICAITNQTGRSQEIHVCAIANFHLLRNRGKNILSLSNN